MGFKSKDFGVRARVLVLFSLAALAGGILAATVTSAQGPGDYQPSTTTVTQTGSTVTVTGTTSPTTTLAGPTQEIVIRLNLKGTAGKQKVGADVEVDVKAKTEVRRRQVVEPILVTGHGRIALKIEATRPRGARCEGHSKGNDRKYKLGTDFDTITDGGTTTLNLKVPKKARKAINKRVICADTKAKAKVRVRASDSSGARGKKDRTVKMRPA